MTVLDNGNNAATFIDDGRGIVPVLDDGQNAVTVPDDGINQLGSVIAGTLYSRGAYFADYLTIWSENAHTVVA